MRLKFPQFLVALVIVGALALGGCSTQQDASQTSPTSAATSTATETSGRTTTEATSVSDNTSESIPGMKNLPRLEGQATVVMTVNGSPITIEVDGTNAPVTAGNFVDLVQRGVYDGTVFHRVVREPQPFVVQGGDPQSKDPKVPVSRLGTGGFIDPDTKNERYVPLEIKVKGEEGIVYSKTVTKPPVLTHKLGAVAMARSQQPDSASCSSNGAIATTGLCIFSVLLCLSRSSLFRWELCCVWQCY